MIILTPIGPNPKEVQITWLIEGVPQDAYSVTVQVDRIDLGPTIPGSAPGTVQNPVVAAGAATAHVSAGVYVYTFPGDLDMSLPYRVTWSVVPFDGATADIVTQDVWPTDTLTTTLADVERELSARVGNFWVDTASYGDNLHVGTLYQTSSIPLGGWQDLWVLRRGVMALDGSAVPGFVATDRERRVKAEPDSDGHLEIDRSYTVAPVVGEQIEFHALQPTIQLRASVLRGLHRIKYVDRLSMASVAPEAERDLTAIAPWVTQPEQVLDLETIYPGSIYVPTKVKNWGKFVQEGHVWIWATPDPYPFRLLVYHWRRADTQINGTYVANYQRPGIAQDADVVHVDVTWAGAAAHVEAWRYFPAVLLPASRTGLSMSQKDTAADFTDKGREFVKVPKTPWNLGKTRDHVFLQAP